MNKFTLPGGYVLNRLRGTETEALGPVVQQDRDAFLVKTNIAGVVTWNAFFVMKQHDNFAPEDENLVTFAILDDDDLKELNVYASDE